MLGKNGGCDLLNKRHYVDGSEARDLRWGEGVCDEGGLAHSCISTSNRHQQALE